MATKKKGMVTVSLERGKHLSKAEKKIFWKGERKAAKVTAMQDCPDSEMVKT